MTIAVPVAPPVAAPAPDRRADLLLACLVAYVLASVGRWHQLFPIFSAFKPVFVTGAAAVGLYVLAAGGRRRFGLVLRAPSAPWLLALLGWAALSVPGALWPGGSFRVATDLAKTIAVSLVLAAAVRGPRDLERLAFAYFIAAAGYAAVVIARFETTTDAWRLGQLYYYDANDFATLAVTAVPLGVHFAAGGGPVLRRIVSGTGLVALTAVIVWSGSRGGFLALLAVGAFLLFRYRAINARWRVLSAAVVAVVFAATASDRYWQKMGTLLRPTEDYNVREETGRLQVWKRGVGYMLQHPLLGVGAGNFPTAEGRLSPMAERSWRGVGVKWSVAHNAFIQVGAELGIPGLVFFGGLLWATLAALHASSRGLGPSLSASLFGFVAGAMFLSLAYSEMLYALAALAIGAWKVDRLDAAARRYAPSSRAPITSQL